jgi:hypothetical protein
VPKIPWQIIREQNLDEKSARKNSETVDTFKAIWRAIPFLTLEDTKEEVPGSEAEAIPQKRQSIITE